MVLVVTTCKTDAMVLSVPLIPGVDLHSSIVNDTQMVFSQLLSPTRTSPESSKLPIPAPNNVILPDPVVIEFACLAILRNPLSNDQPFVKLPTTNPADNDNMRDLSIPALTRHLKELSDCQIVPSQTERLVRKVEEYSERPKLPPLTEIDAAPEPAKFNGKYTTKLGLS